MQAVTPQEPRDEADDSSAVRVRIVATKGLPFPDPPSRTQAHYDVAYGVGEGTTVAALVENSFEEHRLVLEAEGTWEAFERTAQEERASCENECNEIWESEREMCEQTWTEWTERCEPMPEDEAEAQDCDDTYPGSCGASSCFCSDYPDFEEARHCDTDRASIVVIQDGVVRRARFLVSERCDPTVAMVPFDVDGDGSLEWIVETESGQLAPETPVDDPYEFTRRRRLAVLEDDFEVVLATDLQEVSPREDVGTNELVRYRLPAGRRSLIVERVDFAGGCQDTVGLHLAVRAEELEWVAATHGNPAEAQGVDPTHASIEVTVAGLGLADDVLSLPQETDDEACTVTGTSEVATWTYQTASRRWTRRSGTR